MKIKNYYDIELLLDVDHPNDSYPSKTQDGLCFRDEMIRFCGMDLELVADGEHFRMVNPDTEHYNPTKWRFHKDWVVTN